MRPAVNSFLRRVTRGLLEVGIGNHVVVSVGHGLNVADPLTDDVRRVFEFEFGLAAGSRVQKEFLPAFDETLSIARIKTLETPSFCLCLLSKCRSCLRKPRAICSFRHELPLRSLEYQETRLLFVWPPFETATRPPAPLRGCRRVGRLCRDSIFHIECISR